MAKIFIGMPLYNNEKTVATAIDSLLSQTFTDFILFISDDGSKDRTQEICREIAARDPRVIFYHQPVNLNYGNFRYLVRQATSAYFMWAAGDDWWEPTLLEKELAVLENNPQAVCCISKVLFHKNGIPVDTSRGTSTLDRDVATNILNYLKNTDDNSRMYGLFRTEVARKSFPKENFHAYDWSFSAASLLYGTHIEIPEILIKRDYTDPTTYNIHVRRDSPHTFYRLFPAFQMSWHLIFNEKIPLNFPVLVVLFSINFQMHISYARFYHPAYWKILKPIADLWRHYIAWRLVGESSRL